MTIEKHKEKHEELHHSLDELFADYISHTDGNPQNTIYDLIEWSHGQTINPTEDPK